MTRRKIIYYVLALVIVVGGLFLLFALRKHGLVSPNPSTLAPTPAETPVVSQLTNPASKYCVDHGGKLVFKKNGAGSVYGVCDFGDARYCEEWALFRGECPMGGTKIAGFDTEAQIYCAITGGEVDMEKNTCTKNGKVCNIDDYYNEKCSF